MTFPAQVDRVTLIAISALAYIVEVALHEHLGHSTACVLLGSRVVEFGAFYVNCDDSLLSPASVRLVAIAGPAVSLLTGLVSFAVLDRIATPARRAWYFTWLLGALGLMTSTGYALFSGISGLGDLGTEADAALYGASPEWLWRAVLALAGAGSYFLVVRWMSARLDPYAGGSGTARIQGARGLTRASYLTGAVIYLLIGLLNPYGFIIVATSALAASMGGTSGLLWMYRLLDRARNVPPPGMPIARSWGWIGVSIAAVAAYAVFLGPTIRR